ncbi:hypothetical protein MAR_023996 [Mya arenaria]|uniref:Uncharacterized protein n=1 Tax=Mya arenaria TaxID=6604 RepID=A0ABY7DRU7_MYAAR|nr:hypothetical protein MAR_023996 [Mya arenaria]
MERVHLLLSNSISYGVCVCVCIILCCLCYHLILYTPLIIIMYVCLAFAIEWLYFVKGQWQIMSIANTLLNFVINDK